MSGARERAARAGTQVLSLLAVPLNIAILQALAEEPKRLVDLRREVGSPPQTTLRGHLRTLAEVGALEQRRQDSFPGVLDYELTGPGRELLVVAAVVRAWLANAPEGPVSLGGDPAKSAIRALVEGWETSILRALAAKPFSLTELDRLIADVSYPSLERRLATMRFAGQIEPMPTAGRATPYAVTRWLRRAGAPLAAAAGWERSHLRGRVAPITSRDAEAVFLLAVPLLRLPADVSGSCRLAVELQNGGGLRMAGVLVGVEEGRIVSCASRLQGEAGAWASGSMPAWLRALTEHDVDHLEVGGDTYLATALLAGLHGALFGARRSPENAIGTH